MTWTATPCDVYLDYFKLTKSRHQCGHRKHGNLFR